MLCNLCKYAVTVAVLIEVVSLTRVAPTTPASTGGCCSAVLAAPVSSCTLNSHVSVLVESKTILAESPLPYRLTPLPLTHADQGCLLNATPTWERSVSQGQHDQTTWSRLTPAPVCWGCSEWGVGGGGRHARHRQINAVAGQDHRFTSQV